MHSKHVDSKHRHRQQHRATASPRPSNHPTNLLHLHHHHLPTYRLFACNRPIPPHRQSPFKPDSPFVVNRDILCAISRFTKIINRYPTTKYSQQFSKYHQFLQQFLEPSQQFPEPSQQFPETIPSLDATLSCEISCPRDARLPSGFQIKSRDKRHLRVASKAHGRWRRWNPTSSVSPASRRLRIEFFVHTTGVLDQRRKHYLHTHDPAPLSLSPSTHTLTKR